MVRFSGYFCLLLTWSWYEACMGNPLLAGLVVYEKASSIWDGIQKANDFLKNEQPETSLSEIQNQMRSLHNDFQNFEFKIMNKISFDLQDKLLVKADKFFDYAKTIESNYKHFANYIEHPDNYENTSIQDFANSCVREDFRRTVEGMFESLIDPDIKGDNLIAIIMRQSTAREMMCLRQESQQQLINDLYQTYVTFSSKGFMIMSYSYEIKARFENRKYTKERIDLKESFKASVEKATEVFKEAWKMSFRELWRCDPAKHEKGVTYEKLQETFQAYAVYKHDIMQYSFSKYLFGDDCSTVKHSRLNCNSMVCKAQPEERICTGHLRDCLQLNKISQICHAPSGSDRRYEWLREDVDKTELKYGKHYKDECYYRTQGLYYNKWIPKSCICNCESVAREVDRYFSLQEVLSDVQDNKVVTGVRLTKDNHVFHIQIKQGKLGPNATIIDEPKWKNVSSISKAQLLDSKISRVIKGTEEVPENVKYLENDLVYAVTYDNREVFLDVLNGREFRKGGVVVTGMRFRNVLGSLQFQVQFTKFSYTTGKLFYWLNDWDSGTNSRQYRQERVLEEPGDPTDFHDSTDISTENQRIRFRMSDLKNDFGQNTIPFIDIQEVTMNPPMPFSGIGFIHRGRKESGGFLALKVIHYDYADHM